VPSEQRPASPTPTLRAAAADLPSRPVLPDASRRLAGVLAGVSALAVVVLGVVHHASTGPDTFDRTVTAALRTVWAPNDFAYAVDGLVTLLPILVTVALLAGASLLAGQRRLVVVAVLAPFCVAAATTVVKPLVGRTIHGDNLSFPSGHTGYAAAIGVVIGLLLLRLARRVGTAGAAALLLVPPLATGGFMAVDQIVLDAHYPSDTVGGLCTALTVVLVLALVVDPVADRVLARRLA
jgi:membrane-associated phospholipid phosphatase